LDDAIKAWEFEKAAVIRDQIKEIDEWPKSTEGSD
jgi:protein-arginine kinase activator protein McsA